MQCMDSCLRGKSFSPVGRTTVLFFARGYAFCPNLDIFINSATARKSGAACVRRTVRPGSPRTTIPTKKKTFRLA